MSQSASLFIRTKADAMLVGHLYTQILDELRLSEVKHLVFSHTYVDVRTLYQGFCTFCTEGMM